MTGKTPNAKQHRTNNPTKTCKYGFGGWSHFLSLWTVTEQSFCQSMCHIVMFLFWVASFLVGTCGSVSFVMIEIDFLQSAKFRVLFASLVFFHSAKEPVALCTRCIDHGRDRISSGCSHCLVHLGPNVGAFSWVRRICVATKRRWSSHHPSRFTLQLTSVSPFCSSSAVHGTNSCCAH